MHETLIIFIRAYKRLTAQGYSQNAGDWVMVPKRIPK